MLELIALAERVASAPGPDRELDAATHAALGHCVHDMQITRVEVEPGEHDAVVRCSKCGDYKGVAPGRYTASLDAAMTLVPGCPDGGGGKWAVVLDSGFYGATATLWHECSAVTHHGHAAGSHEALPRALTSAALRARAALSTTPDLSRDEGRASL